MHVTCVLLTLAAASECPTSSCDPASIVIPIPSKVTLTGGTTAVEGPVAETLDKNLANLGDEGYRLICHQEGYRLTAAADRGLFYGRQTLSQLKQLGLVPCCVIEDVPLMKMRAVMFDLARCKEKHEYYYHIIDQLAQWKINTVFLHLTDHSGCALEFRSYPHLATANAFTQDEMRKLIKYAQEKHIELIPEIESWGHAKYITRLPELADLAEDPNDPRALCTSNPKTWEVLGKLFDEVAGLFPSRYIHAGCDEAAFGKCEQCTAKAKRDGVDALVGEHLRKVHDLVATRGKVPMMWGDVLMQHRGAVEMLPKDTIITHWDYKASPSPEPVVFLKEKGYEVIGSPAVVWGSRMILPMADTFDSVAGMARIALDNRCLGMETTIWLPQRYIADTLPAALAHAAEQSWSGNRRPRPEFVQAFAKNYYKLDPAPEMLEALADVHSLSMKSFAVLLNPWEYVEQCTGQTNAELAANAVAQRDRASAITAKLGPLRQKVASHLAEYDAILLAADTAVHVWARAVTVHALINAVRTARRLPGEGGTPDADRILREAAALADRLQSEEDAIRVRHEEAWDRWRYADDPLKTGTGETIAGAFHTSRRFGETVRLRLLAAREALSRGEMPDWSEVFREPHADVREPPPDVGDTAPGQAQTDG